MNGAFVARLPKLKAMVRYGVGHDNVDLAATERHHVRVANVQSYANMDCPIPIEYFLCPTPGLNDEVVTQLKAGSMVINAIGLGKDAPGSPLTDAAAFPEQGIAWDFNYRGDLVFLEQARAQKEARGLDGHLQIMVPRMNQALLIVGHYSA